MGIWKEIKYALNSKLGTKDFKPLDELIIQQTKMVVSDDLYETFADFEFEVPSDESIYKNYPIKLSMARYGEMRLAGDIYRSSILHGRVIFRVYRNEQEIYSFKENAGSGDKLMPFSVVVEFKPNDKIRLELYGTNTATYSGAGKEDFGIHNLKAYGTFKETAYLNEYITE